MTLLKNTLFYVPIYPESQSKYFEYLTLKQKKTQSDLLSRAKKLGQIQYESEKKYLEENPPPLNPNGIAWKFNRIIGWIEFYNNGGIIKANLHFTGLKRIQKILGKHVISYQYKIADVSDTYRKNNEQIRNDIEKFLLKLQNGKYSSKIKRYYIDSHEFLRILKYIDIKKIINDSINSDVKN